jgi:ribosomal protein L16 Arg81 hydroxylase
MNTLSDLIQEAKSEGKHYAVFKNWHQPTPTRKEMKALYGSEDDPTQRLYIKDKSIPDEINHFLDQASAAYPESDNHFYVLASMEYKNYFKRRPGARLHRDNFDVIHWQLTGVTKWNIGLNAESKNNPAKITRPEDGPSYDGEWNWQAEFTEEPDTFVLEPGDVIWFSKYAWHTTENLCDKYSLVMLSGNEKSVLRKDMLL